MKESEQTGISRRDTIETVAGATAQTVGEVVSLIPGGALAGALLKGGAGAFGKFTGWASDFVSGQRSRRAAELIEQVTASAERENLTEIVEGLGDVVTEALCASTTAETECKRQLMAEIILNAARRAEKESAKAEALCALRLIAEMPAEAALTFAVVARRYSRSVTRQAGTYYDIPLEGSFDEIPGGVASLGVRHLQSIGLAKSHDLSHSTVSLTPQGHWLAAWIIADRAIHG